MKTVLLLFMATAGVEHITVDGREYELVAHVTYPVCDDLHPTPCHPRAKGVRCEEEAQVSIVGFRPFPQICKTEHCAGDSREEWVRTAIRRAK